jgi:hypothetical protein
VSWSDRLRRHYPSFILGLVSGVALLFFTGLFLPTFNWLGGMLLHQIKGEDARIEILSILATKSTVDNLTAVKVRFKAMNTGSEDLRLTLKLLESDSLDVSIPVRYEGVTIKGHDEVVDSAVFYSYELDNYFRRIPTDQTMDWKVIWTVAGTDKYNIAAPHECERIHFLLLPTDSIYVSDEIPGCLAEFRQIVNDTFFIPGEGRMQGRAELNFYLYPADRISLFMDTSRDWKADMTVRLRVKEAKVEKQEVPYPEQADRTYYSSTPITLPGLQALDSLLLAGSRVVGFSLDPSIYRDRVGGYLIGAAGTVGSVDSVLLRLVGGDTYREIYRFFQAEIDPALLYSQQFVYVQYSVR